MALSDPTQTRTTDMQTSTTNYIAGEEPWNKNIEGYSIDSKSTEASTYVCDWTKWHGLYRNVPELRSCIDVSSRWIVGKKLTMSPATKKIVDRWRGNGIDTPRKILTNIKRVSKIGGDCYAEKIKDKAGRLINLKILDPGTIKIVANDLGIITKYEQVSRKPNQNVVTVLSDWEPDEIFHIANDRIADEIHGIPDSEKLQKLIKTKHQGMDDHTVVLHRYGKPTFFYEANTDDETEVEHIKEKIDAAIKGFENVVTVKDALSNIERTSVPHYSIPDPVPWFEFIRSYFTESSGVPDLIRGKSDEVSLAAGKLNYLGYKEKIIMEQLEYSEEIKTQLNLDISFEEPVEIDIEISKTEEDQALKTQAKKEKGGENIVTTATPPK